MIKIILAFVAFVVILYIWFAKDADAKQAETQRQERELRQRKLDEVKAIKALSEQMLQDDKCQRLMERVEDVLKVNMYQLEYVSFGLDIEIRIGVQSTQPWGVNDTRIIRIRPLEFGVSLSQKEELQIAFAYCILQRNSSLTYNYKPAESLDYTEHRDLERVYLECFIGDGNTHYDSRCLFRQGYKRKY